jgi:trimethylamine:corrinoid methyltransferase-like protein
MFSVLRDVDVEILGDGVLRILEKQGFYCENAEMLNAWEQAGAKVDYATHVACFPQDVMQRFVESLRKEDKTGWFGQLSPEDKQIIYSGYHPYKPDVYFKACEPTYMFHNLSTLYYDDRTGERRTGNKADFIDLIKIGDGVHPGKGMGHALNLSDTPSEIEPLEAAMIELEYSKNPRGVYVHDVRQIPYLEEIESIFGIRDPYWHWMANICPNSPLKLDRVVSERFVHTVKSGIYPCKLAAMPVAGVNVPATTAGMTVIIAAEFLALWFATRLLQSKKIPLVGLPVLGTMDIKTGAVSFTGFDVAIRRFTVCEFLRKWADVQLAPGPGEWSPTKEPGLYCTMEKAYFAMTAAAFTGHHPEIGVGHIDGGLAISPMQFLLDYEFTQGLSQLEPPGINEQQLCLDSIFDIGFGFKKNFMEDDFTLANLRTNLWTPEVFSRNGWSRQIEREVHDKAKVRLDQIRSSYVKPTGLEGKLAKARSVVTRARKALCK